MQHSSFTFPLRFLCIWLNSQFDGNDNRTLNFHRTVLEAYWELDAGIGTKMTANNCTFSSFASFLVSVHFCLSFFEKTLTPSPNFRHFHFGECWFLCSQWMRDRDGAWWYRKYRIWGPETRGNSRGVRVASLHQIWCSSGWYPRSRPNREDIVEIT